MRREFAAAEPAALQRLVGLYKARLVPASTSSGGSASSTAAGSAELQFAAVGSPAAAAGADLSGPLGPAEVAVSSLTDAQRPEGLPPGLWERFVAYRAAQGRLDIAVREQAFKVRLAAGVHLLPVPCCCLNTMHSCLLLALAGAVPQAAAGAATAAPGGAVN